MRVPLAEGRLVRVLEDWCPPYAGYRLYRPSRRQPTPAFASLVNALRYRDGAAAARGGLGSVRSGPRDVPGLRDARLRTCVQRGQRPIRC